MNNHSKTKRFIVFDLDGTLTQSKVPLSEGMADLLRQLLGKCEVGVISGASFERFMFQLLKPLNAEAEEVVNLHILPTNGTHYYRYDLDLKDWKEIYSDTIPEAQRDKIVRTLEEVARKMGFWPDQPWGQVIEDRGSQVTFSALGQDAPLDPKQLWDVDNSKKKKLRDAIADALPEYSVHYAGLTSIDVTIKGLNKASALRKLKDVLGILEAEILFIGDALDPGGNDYVVAEAGIESIAVQSPEETAKLINQLLASNTNS